MRIDTRDRRAGFTLIEALIALAVIVSFAGALGPHLFHARRIVANGAGRAAAALLLRSLIQAPFDRSGVAGATEGAANGFRWSVVVEPIVLDTPAFDDPASAGAAKDMPKWAPYRVLARVLWGENQSIAAETVRLGRAQ